MLIGIIIVASVIFLLLLTIIIIYNSLSKLNVYINDAFLNLDVLFMKKWGLFRVIASSVEETDELLKEEIDNLVSKEYVDFAFLNKIDSINVLSNKINVLTLSNKTKISADLSVVFEEIKKLDEEINAFEEKFNAIIKTYNLKFSVFPNKVVGKLFRFRPYKQFKNISLIINNNEKPEEVKEVVSEEQING